MQQREEAIQVIPILTSQLSGVMATRKRAPTTLLLVLAVALFATGPGAAEEAYATSHGGDDPPAVGCKVPDYAGGGNAIDGDFLTEPGGAISRCENGHWRPYLSSGPPPCGQAEKNLHWFTPYGAMKCDGQGNWKFESQDPGCTVDYDIGPGPARRGQFVSLTSPAPTTIFAHCGAPHGRGQGLWRYPDLRPSRRDAPAYPDYSLRTLA